MLEKHLQLILALCCALMLLASCKVAEVQTYTFSAGKEYKVSLRRKEEKVIHFDLKGMKVFFNVDITTSGPFNFCILSQTGQC